MKNITRKIGYKGIGMLASLGLAFFFFIFLSFIWPIGELYLYDTRLSLLRSPQKVPEVLFISIDQKSQDEIGRFPWKRTEYVRLLEALKNNPPGVFAFDILFQEPSPVDKEFTEGVKNAGFPVVAAFNVEKLTAVGDYRIIPVVPSLEKVVAGTGHIDITLDKDGVVRRTTLAKNVNGITYPSLALSSFAIMKGIKPKDIQYGKNEIRVGGTTIPTNERYEIFIDYFFPLNTGTTVMTFPKSSFVKAIEYADKMSDLSKKAVILGAGAYGMRDDFPTPVKAGMFGAIIHGNIINTLESGKFLKKVPFYLNFAIAMLIGIIYGFMGTRFKNAKNIALFSLGFLIIYVIINLTLFKYGWWVDLLAPGCVIFSGALVSSGIQFLRTKSLFKQFVAEEVVSQMVSSEMKSDLGGQEKEVSIFFTDIRGYTTLSEKMAPTDVMAMLNEYHTIMVKVFKENNGQVLNYIGDAQLVVFGAPIALENHPYWACRTALKIRKALEELRQKWGIKEVSSFDIGIGITTGVVAIGLVGAEDHKQYTVIGDAVNVAARLESYTKEAKVPILISPETANRVKDKFELKSMGEVMLKGKTVGVELFTITGEKE